MPAITVMTTTTSSSAGGEGHVDQIFLDQIVHQQMLLYIVCGLGGVLLIMIVVCIVCGCKKGQQRQPGTQQRRAAAPGEQRPRPARNHQRNVQRADARVRPSPSQDYPESPSTSTDTRRHERIRKRSTDMRANRTTQLHANNPSSLNNQVDDYRLTQNGFLSP